MLRTAHILVGSIRAGDATSQHAFDLARALREHGLGVGIYCAGSIGPLPPDIRPLAHWTFAGEYEPNADVVLLEYPIWYPLAERLKDAPGTRVFWYHGVTPPELWGTATERDILERSLIGTELAWHAHQVIATSPFTATELARHSGYPRERMHVVPNGVDLAAFATTPAPAVLERTAARWRLSGRRVLLAVGRIAGNKRLDLTLEAFARLAPRYPHLHLVIVGEAGANAAEADVAQALRSQVERLGLQERVTFTGRVEAVEPFYHLAEVYVSASQHEGFGVPLIEAMAAGIPVVASASGAMPWVLGVEDGSAAPAGLVFQSGDAADLAVQIARLLDAPGERQQMIAQGKARAQTFARERFMQQAWEALQAALEAAKREPPLAAERTVDPLVRRADVALRNYRVRSRVPLLGRLIEWVRINSTTHVKEAYLDRVIEQQVMYNRLLADEILRLRREIAELRGEQANTPEEEAKGLPKPPSGLQGG